MKNRKAYLLLVLSLAFSLAGFAKSPKNIIILIGDGMGINQVQAGYTANGGHLNMTDRCPYSGFRRTNSANKYTTDSAAGGTAIACGQKTDNGMVGVTPDGTPINSIIRLADMQGWATGVVSTSSITDATPASFVAHQPTRKNQEEIAAQFLESDIDLFIGGGRKFFENRKDGRNISKELEAKGYKMGHALSDVNPKESRRFGLLLADDGMEPASKREDGHLAKATEMAIEALSQNKKGFVLMVEGSQIDWGGHNNDQAYMVGEVLDFDRAVGKALDFAERDGNTLVVITADHETGGAVIADGNYDKKELRVKFTTGGHTASPVPFFSYGPGAERFAGFKDNTASFHIMKDLLRIK